MNLYCVRFRREYRPDGNMEHNFFIFARTKAQARKRFCVTTGYDGYCIVSIHVLK